MNVREYRHYTAKAPTAKLANAKDDVFVTFEQLEGLIGRKYSRVHLRRMIRRGHFPAPVQLSPNRIAWPLSIVVEWKKSRRMGPVRPLPDAS